MSLASSTYAKEKDNHILIEKCPWKFKLLQSLGLDELLMDKFVKGYSKTPYTFNRKLLRFITT